MKLALVSCSKTKRTDPGPHRAPDLYAPSPLFRKAWLFVTLNYDIAAILSAKYGLCLADDLVQPYEETLKDMSRAGRQAWAERVFVQMHERLPLDSIHEVHFHTGKEYREYLWKMLEGEGKSCACPVAGLRLGERMKWYGGGKLR